MTNTRGAEVWGGTFVLAERALLLCENPGGDVAVAGERVELDPVDGGGLERPRAMARRHAQSGRRSPIPRSSSSSSSCHARCSGHVGREGVNHPAKQA